MKCHKFFEEVYWYLPNNKKKFAISSLEVSNSIVNLAKDKTTIIEAYCSKNADFNTRVILEYYIKYGYGNFLLKDFIVENNHKIYHKKYDCHVVELSNKEVNEYLDFYKV